MKIKTLLAAILPLIILSASCNPRRAPIVDERDDGEVMGSLTVSRGAYREGEVVKVTFELVNTSQDTVTLARQDGVVVDLELSKGPIRMLWSEEVEEIHQLTLEPGETYMIEWEFSDLTIGRHGIAGIWWSRDAREEILGAVFDYGPTRY